MAWQVQSSRGGGGRGSAGDGGLGDKGDELHPAAAFGAGEHVDLVDLRDIGALPVLGDDDRLVGIVTDRDVCMAAYFTDAALTSLPIAHAMSKVVFTAGPSQDLEGAEKLMCEKQIRRLPVLDHDKLVGMITVGDLARASKARRQVSGNEVSATLAAITQPRAPPVTAAA